tara:strand:- start:5247 stop:6893 length:1647 start_codon:yes stop_codon:yes gene_type:complete
MAEVNSPFARRMMAQKLMMDNKTNPFEQSEFFQPSDALEAPRVTGMLLPFSARRFGDEKDLRLAVPELVSDFFDATVGNTGKALRGELGVPSVNNPAFTGAVADMGMNVTGGSLLGSNLIKGAVPKNALAMGLFSGSKSVKSLDDIKNKYPNVDLSVSSKPEGITLSKIVVPESARSEGIGSNVMKDLIKYADENNLPIALTPDSSFGGSKTRLKSFYRKFGFKDNKGRNKDFSFRESMIRQPKQIERVKPGDIAKVVPPTDKSDGIFAFHGSGADFDEFKLSKIGTGEGNQAFGYGLYFTDSEDIAKFYKNQILRTQNVEFNGKPIKFLSDSQDIDNKTVVLGKIRDRILGGKLNSKEAIDSVKSEYQQTIDNSFDLSRPLNKIDKMNYDSIKSDLDYINTLDAKDFNYQPGKIYEVKIKAVTDDLIDYDKPLKDQNEKIKKILKPYYEYYGVAQTADFGTLLESTYRHLPQDVFTERLSKEGIKGIKYKAGQLTSGQEDSKATNFVIFDDKIIDIMAKYGITGAIGVSAMKSINGGSESNTLPSDA